MLESYSDKLMKDLDIYGDKAAKVKSFALQCLVIGFALGMTETWGKGDGQAPGFSRGDTDPLCRIREGQR
jgi:hypothetical protein